jgi:hypothetical protein
MFGKWRKIAPNLKFYSAPTRSKNKPEIKKAGRDQIPDLGPLLILKND